MKFYVEHFESEPNSANHEKRNKRIRGGINKIKNNGNNTSSAVVKGIMLQIMKKHAGGIKKLNKQLGVHEMRKKRREEREHRRIEREQRRKEKEQRHLAKAVRLLETQKHTGHRQFQKKRKHRGRGRNGVRRKHNKKRNKFQKNQHVKPEELKDLDAKRHGLFKNTKTKAHAKTHTTGGRTLSKKSRGKRFKGKRRGRGGKKHGGHRGRGKGGLRVIRAPKRVPIVTPEPYNVTISNTTLTNKTKT